MEHTDDDIDRYIPQEPPMNYDTEPSFDDYMFYRNTSLTRAVAFDSPTTFRNTGLATTPATSFSDGSGMHLTPAKPQMFHSSPRPAAMSPPSMTQLQQFPSLNQVSNLPPDFVSPFQAAFPSAAQNYDQSVPEQYSLQHYDSIYGSAELDGPQESSFSYNGTAANGLMPQDRAFIQAYQLQQASQGTTFTMEYPAAMPDNIIGQYLPPPSPPASPDIAPTHLVADSGPHQRPFAPRLEIFASVPRSGLPHSDPSIIGLLPSAQQSSRASTNSTPISSAIASPASAQFVNLSDLAPESQPQDTPSSSGYLDCDDTLMQNDSHQTPKTSSTVRCHTRGRLRATRTRGKGLANGGDEYKDSNASFTGTQAFKEGFQSEKHRLNETDASRESFALLNNPPLVLPASPRLPSPPPGTGSDSDISDEGMLLRSPSNTGISLDDQAGATLHDNAVPTAKSPSQTSAADAEGSAVDPADIPTWNDIGSGDDFNDDADDADYDDDDSDDDYSPTGRSRSRYRARTHAGSDPGAGGNIKHPGGSTRRGLQKLSAAQALARLAAQNPRKDSSREVGGSRRSRSSGNHMDVSNGRGLRREGLMLPRPVPNLTKKSRGRKVPAVAKGHHTKGEKSPGHGRRQSVQDENTQNHMDVDLRDRMNYGDLDVDMNVPYSGAPPESDFTTKGLSYEHIHNGTPNNHDFPAHGGEYSAHNVDYLAQGNASHHNSSADGNPEESDEGETEDASPDSADSPPNPRTVRGRRVPTVDPSAVAVTRRGGRASRTASGKRTYVCDVKDCGKGFVRGEHLKRHIRSIHTYEKPFVCPSPGCGKRFSRRDNLGQHARVHFTG